MNVPEDDAAGGESVPALGYRGAASVENPFALLER